MAFDVVKQITQIEKEGEELVKKAQLNAQDEKKKAEIEADNMVKKAKKDAEEYYNQRIVFYENEAKESAKPIMAESQKMQTKLNSIPEALLQKAVNMVIERIVNSHGNS